MSPQEGTPPVLPTPPAIQWNVVTWFSKILALFLFIAFVVGAFFYGRWYEHQTTQFAEGPGTALPQSMTNTHQNDSQNIQIQLPSAADTAMSSTSPIMPQSITEPAPSPVPQPTPKPKAVAPTPQPTPAPAPKIVVVTSPKDGDEFCRGDIIPIKYTAPNGVDYARIRLLSPVAGSGNLGVLVGVKDQQTSVVSYTYQWDGTYESSVEADHEFWPSDTAYQAIVDVAMRDGSSLTGKSPGRFSFIDCHTGAQPPMLQ